MDAPINHESQAIPPLSQLPSLTIAQSPPHSVHDVPFLAIAVLGILAVALLLISYYVFVTKCYFRWQQADPLRRFSVRPMQWTEQEPPSSHSHSPSWPSRGLNELLIRQIPTFLYRKQSHELGGKCVVCLNEFRELDLLRLLPKCSHAFHSDCIDVWLQMNSNCPLCRSTISGRNRYQPDRIVAPNSSPQDPQDTEADDFVVIELRGPDGEGNSSEAQQETGDSRTFLAQSGSCSWRKLGQKMGNQKRRNFKHISIMGDEGIVDEEDQFSFQPIRRSFSMDSDLIRNGHISHARGKEASSSRSQRWIFSFRQGNTSRNAVLPVQF